VHDKTEGGKLPLWMGGNKRFDVPWESLGERAKRLVVEFS